MKYVQYQSIYIYQLKSRTISQDPTHFFNDSVYMRAILD